MYDFSKIKKLSDAKSLALADIEEYCMDNDKIDWMIEAAHKHIMVKNGKEQLNFLRFKNAFLKEVIGIKVETQEKKTTFLERIAALEAARKQ